MPTRKVSHYFYIALPWLCWVSATGLYFYTYGLLTLPTSLAPLFEEHFDFTAVEISLISTAFLYTYVSMQIPAGLLVDKYGARAVSIISGICLTLGSLIFALAQHPTVHLIARLLMGLGGSAAFIVTLSLARAWFSAALFPILVAITESMSGLGSIAIPSIFTLLDKIQPWTIALLEIALVGFALLMLITFFVRDKKHKSDEKRPNMLQDFKAVAFNGRVWLLIIFVSFCFAHYAALSNMWRVPWASSQLEMSYQNALLFNGIDIAGFVVGCLVIGFFAIKFEAGKVALFAGTAEIIMLVITNGLSYVLLSHPHNTVLLILWSISLFILGLTTGGILLGFELVKRVIPENAYGCSAGFLNMSFGAIGIFMVPLYGLIMDHYNIKSAIPVILTVIFMTVIGVLALVLFLRACPKDGLSGKTMCD